MDSNQNGIYEVRDVREEFSPYASQKKQYKIQIVDAFK